MIRADLQKLVEGYVQRLVASGRYGSTTETRLRALA